MTHASPDRPAGAPLPVLALPAPPAFSPRAHDRLAALGQAAFAVLTGKTHTGYDAGDPLLDYERQLDAVIDDAASRVLLRARVPEIEPTVRDVARGLGVYVPLSDQLRRDHIFRTFTRERALAFIERRREEADRAGLEALAMPLRISGADYIVHYHRRDGGETVGHL